MIGIEDFRSRILDFKFTWLLLFISVLFLLSGCEQKLSGEKQSFARTTDQEVIQLTPKKPTRIVLKKTSKGKYTWELKGEDVEDIISIDGRLRKYISKNNMDEKR